MNTVGSGRCRSGVAGKRVAGFTLVELMVALVLGLIIIAGVISVFLANKQSYRTNEALGQVQDTTRVAFELLSRDVRGAGGTPCGNPSDRIANVVNNNADSELYDWSKVVWGYDEAAANDTVLDQIPAGPGEPVSDPDEDSLHLMGAGLGSGIAVVNQKQNAANFKISDKTDDFVGGDIIMVCDPDHATVLQISNYDGNNVTVEYNSGGSQTPGNCSKGLGIPTDCSSPNGNPYEFGINSQLARLEFFAWYIGTNPAGTRSLYRVPLAAGATVGTPTEMVRGVTGMQVLYLVDADNDGAAELLDSTAIGTDETDEPTWEKVKAIRIELTMESRDTNVTTDAGSAPLERNMAATVTLRNRVN